MPAKLFLRGPKPPRSPWEWPYRSPQYHDTLRYLADEGGNGDWLFEERTAWHILKTEGDKPEFFFGLENNEPSPRRVCVEDLVRTWVSPSRRPAWVKPGDLRSMIRFAFRRPLMGDFAIFDELHKIDPDLDVLFHTNDLIEMWIKWDELAKTPGITVQQKARFKRNKQNLMIPPPPRQSRQAIPERSKEESSSGPSMVTDSSSPQQRFDSHFEEKDEQARNFRIRLWHAYDDIEDKIENLDSAYKLYNNIRLEESPTCYRKQESLRREISNEDLATFLKLWGLPTNHIPIFDGPAFYFNADNYPTREHDEEERRRMSRSIRLTIRTFAHLVRSYRAGDDVTVSVVVAVISEAFSTENVEAGELFLMLENSELTPIDVACEIVGTFNEDQEETGEETEGANASVNKVEQQMDQIDMDLDHLEDPRTPTNTKAVEKAPSSGTEAKSLTNGVTSALWGIRMPIIQARSIGRRFKLRTTFVAESSDTAPSIGSSNQRTDSSISGISKMEEDIPMFAEEGEDGPQFYIRHSRAKIQRDAMPVNSENQIQDESPRGRAEASQKEVQKELEKAPQKAPEKAPQKESREENQKLTQGEIEKKPKKSGTKIQGDFMMYNPADDAPDSGCENPFEDDVYDEWSRVENINTIGGTRADVTTGRQEPIAAQSRNRGQGSRSFSNPLKQNRKSVNEFLCDLERHPKLLSYLQEIEIFPHAHKFTGAQVRRLAESAEEAVLNGEAVIRDRFDEEILGTLHRIQSIDNGIVSNPIDPGLDTLVKSTRSRKDFARQFLADDAGPDEVTPSNGPGEVSSTIEKSGSRLTVDMGTNSPTPATTVERGNARSRSLRVTSMSTNEQERRHDNADDSSAMKTSDMMEVEYSSVDTLLSACTPHSQIETEGSMISPATSTTDLQAKNGEERDEDESGASLTRQCKIAPPSPCSALGRKIRPYKKSSKKNSTNTKPSKDRKELNNDLSRGSVKQRQSGPPPSPRPKHKELPVKRLSSPRPRREELATQPPPSPGPRYADTAPEPIPSPGLVYRAAEDWATLNEKDAFEFSGEVATAAKMHAHCFMEWRRDIRRQVKVRRAEADKKRDVHSFFSSANTSSTSSSSTAALNKLFDKYRGERSANVFGVLN